jgi:hypothetical protein
MDIIRAIVTQVDEELSRISDERRSEDQPGLKPLEEAIVRYSVDINYFVAGKLRL